MRLTKEALLRLTKEVIISAVLFNLSFEAASLIDTASPIDAASLRSEAVSIRLALSFALIQSPHKVMI